MDLALARYENTLNVLFSISNDNNSAVIGKYNDFIIKLCCTTY